MSKVTMTIEDFGGQVAVLIEITGYDSESKAVQLSERVDEFINSIAVREDDARTVRTAGELSLAHLVTSNAH